MKAEKSIMEMQRADNSNAKGSTYVKEPTKDEKKIRKEKKTASAIENVKIDIWNDAIFKARLLWSGDFDLFYSNIEKIKKKHLETK